MHLPSCLKCTESFAIISRLKAIISERLDDLKTSYKRAPTTSPQEANTQQIAAITNPPLLGGVRENEDSDSDSDSDLDASTEVEARPSTGPQDQGAANTLPLVTDENSEAPIDWLLKTIAELKDELRRRKLPVGGRKSALVERIQSSSQQEVSGAADDSGIANGIDWTKTKVKDLKDECKSRGLVVGGNRAALLKRIIDYDLASQQSAAYAASLRDLSTEEILALQNLEELAHDIGCRKQDLIEYRSHIARHLSEDDHAKNELTNLADDTAIVTSDYKMKILACFFRENQKKWFGKRGTSMLGFMITTNSSDEADKAKGIKNVSFVMMVTDDCLQDEHEVACAKKTIYEKYLPPHVKKVCFTADGAGCFKSQYHRAFQPFWKVWTGKDEISYRITPAGDGKSALDGMFGRLNTVLSTAVNSGMSYWDSSTILEAVEASNGLAASEFVRFAPDRERKVEVDLQRINLESVLLTTLDPHQEPTDQSTLAYKHSGYGNGARINPSSQIDFSWWKPNGKKKRKQDYFPIEGVYNVDVSPFFFVMQKECLF
jgi:hypothetical protein